MTRRQLLTGMNKRLHVEAQEAISTLLCAPNNDDAIPSKEDHGGSA